MCGAVSARSAGEILEAARSSDWRRPDPARLLVMQLAARPAVVIELAPAFAPAHVSNILELARAGFFDGRAVTRAQDNYVAQWGDGAALDAHPGVGRKLPAEYSRPLDGAPPFIALADADVYAPETGFADGFPAARNRERGALWMTHCYGMVGVGREDPPDSGSGAELYAVIGHAPRHLDRNIALVGRVIQGIESLSTLPRGTGPLGFYETPGEQLQIVSLRVAADLPAAERPALELLRTDTPLWSEWVAARRSRTESWFVEPAGRIEVCNLNVPVRPAQK